MESEILTNTDIETISNKYLKMKVKCIPTYNLNRHKCVSGYYCINLNNMHWTALYIDHKDAFYFDPFGVIYPTEVFKFCKKKRIIYNTDQIQKLDQYCCGYYCIMFLHFMKTNKLGDPKYRLNKFLSLFSEDENDNDNILQNYIKKII